MKIRMGRGRWEVVAAWYGEERVIFTDPCIFECIRYRGENG